MKTKDEILDECCKKREITFLSAYYLEKGFKLPQSEEGDYNNLQKAILEAMEEYAFLKVAESESKNLKQAHVIKSVCHQHDFENGIHTRDTCKNCGKSIYE